MITFFRTSQTGVQVFAITWSFAIWKIGPYPGAVVAGLGLWPPEGIRQLEVEGDVAAWLMALPEPA